MPREKQQAAKGKPSAWAEREKALNSQALEYEEAYFEDFTLEPNSILGEFLYFTNKDDNALGYYSMPHIDLRSNNIKVKITVMEKGVAGRFDHDNRVIDVDPKYADDIAVILHEMIHAYIFVLKRKCDFMYENLLLMLYEDLSGKIPDLRERITKHGHAMYQNNVFRGDGDHGILFYLKCLDLELRLNLPFGKISLLYPAKKMRFKKRVYSGA